MSRRIDPLERLDTTKAIGKLRHDTSKPVDLSGPEAQAVIRRMGEGIAEAKKESDRKQALTRAFAKGAIPCLCGDACVPCMAGTHNHDCRPVGKEGGERDA